MHIVMLVLSSLAGVLWWWVRRNPREAAYKVQDTYTTLKNAPRRLAFRRQTNEHPVEAIDDSRIALGALAQAFVELDDLPTKEQRQQFSDSLCNKLGMSQDEAKEMQIHGRWLIDQCNGPSQAITRLSRKLFKMSEENSWDLLQDHLMAQVSGKLSQRQVESIQEIKNVFRK